MSQSLASLPKPSSRRGRKQTSVARHCYNCGAIVWATPYDMKIGIKKYCSEKCMWEFGNCTHRGADHYRFGKTVSAEVKEKIRKTKTGVKTGPHSPEWNERISKSQIGLQAGSKHPRWQGGITSENVALKAQRRYRKWSLDVRERAGNKCSVCGTEKDLVAHHIHSWRVYPELRYSVENGLSMCRRCHAKFHWTDELSFGRDAGERLVELACQG